MSPYPRAVEDAMRTFFRSLRENDRRRYAAVEAAKLDVGGRQVGPDHAVLHGVAGGVVLQNLLK